MAEILLAALIGAALVVAALFVAIGAMLWPRPTTNCVEESPHDLRWLTQPPPGRVEVEARPAVDVIPLDADPTLSFVIRYPASRAVDPWWNGNRYRPAEQSRLRTAPYVLAPRGSGLHPTAEYPQVEVRW